MHVCFIVMDFCALHKKYIDIIINNQILWSHPAFTKAVHYFKNSSTKVDEEIIFKVRID